MSKTWLEIVMPASLVLIFCTIMVFGLSVSGLLDTPGTDASESATAQVGGCGVMDSPMGTVDSATIVSAGLLPEQEATLLAGDALFKGNCAQCHDVNEVIVGPALAGIAKRRPMSWITAWVKNSSKMVARGDEYSVKIFNQYQKQQMPSFQLSDQEIKAIVAYIEYQQ